LTDHIAGYESGRVGQGYDEARKQGVNVDQKECGSDGEQGAERETPDGPLPIPCGIKSRHAAA
jgi:hypothetical protein